MIEAKERDGRIVVSGPLEHRDWYAALPGAFWAPGRVWSVDLSAETVHAIAKTSPGAVRFDRPLLDLLNEQVAKLRVNGSKPPADQPAIRVADSWRHQCEAYRFALPRAATMLEMGMGTGKSKVACDLMANWPAGPTLISCPPSVLGVWRRELALWTRFDPAASLILDNGWTAKRKAEEADKHLKRHKHAIIAVSYQTAIQQAFGSFAKTRPWQLVMLDESHRAKSATGATGKLAWCLGKRAAHRLTLTGTPMPHSPPDLFSQLRFLDRSLLGESWTSFKHRYCEVGGPTGRQIIGFRQLDELMNRYHSITYRVGREVLDLPPAVHVERPCRMPAATERIYREIEDELIADVGDKVCVAANALVKWIRLTQITSGFVSLVDEFDPGPAELRRINTAKSDVLADILEDLPSDEPVVVFCIYRADLDEIKRVTESLGRRYGELSGRRHDLTPEAKMPEGIDVLGCHAKSGSVGVDLTRACHAVLYSVGFDRGDYDQELARLHRPGQTRPVRYYHLITEGAIDRRIYTALGQRRDLIDSLLESYGARLV